jgi:hypothetical protein
MSSPAHLEMVTEVITDRIIVPQTPITVQIAPAFQWEQISSLVQEGFQPRKPLGIIGNPSA